MIVKCTVEFETGSPLVIEDGKVSGSTKQIREFAEMLFDDTPEVKKQQYLPPIDTVVAEQVAISFGGNATTEVVVEDSGPDRLERLITY